MTATIDPLGPPPERVRARRRTTAPKSRRRKILEGAAIVLALVVIFILLLLWILLGRIDRLPDLIQGERPADARGQTYLLLGTDRRSIGQTTGRDAVEDEFERGEQRADMIMLVHLTEGSDAAYGVSIPRDSYVPIPGYGRDKINAAFSYGGAKLMVQTVEELTDLHIDHVAIVDFQGFSDLTDAVGGVDIIFAEDTQAPGNDVTWQRGVQRLDGEQALVYVRQRYDLPGGDFDRVRRQQNYLRQLTGQTVAASTFSNPGRLKSLLDAITANVTVDDSWGRFEMFRLGLALRSFDAGNLDFYTVPTLGTGMAGAASIVVYDDRLAPDFWELFADDDPEALQQAFGDLVLGPTVR